MGSASWEKIKVPENSKSPVSVLQLYCYERNGTGCITKRGIIWKFAVQCWE